MCSHGGVEIKWSVLLGRLMRIAMVMMSAPGMPRRSSFGATPREYMMMVPTARSLPPPIFPTLDLHKFPNHPSINKMIFF